MKTFVTQPYEVEKMDGTKVQVCCAPAIVKIEGVKAYRPIGPEIVGKVCCHSGRSADIARKHTEELRESLRY